MTVSVDSAEFNSRSAPKVNMYISSFRRSEFIPHSSNGRRGIHRHRMFNYSPFCCLWLTIYFSSPNVQRTTSRRHSYNVKYPIGAIFVFVVHLGIVGTKLGGVNGANRHHILTAKPGIYTICKLRR